MPPKISLGSKNAPLKPMALGGQVKIPLPQKIIKEAPPKLDILADSEMQKTISSAEKNIIMGDNNVKEDMLPRYIIDGVDFAILNADILNKLKVVNVSDKIIRAAPFDASSVENFTTRNKNYPPCTYVVDMQEILQPDQSITSYTQMGTVENNKRCATCYKTNIDCPGHLGEIVLNQKFVHPLFREYLIKVLTCVCRDCSNLLIKEEQMKQQGIDRLQGKVRLNAIYEICKEDKVVCRNKNCGPKYCYIDVNKKQFDDTGYKLRYKYKCSDSTKDALPQEISKTYNIVNAISEKDAKLLGFKNGSHPKDMIMETLAVIPPCARPYTIRDGTPREEHLTTAYDEIIRDNYRLSITSDIKRREEVEKDLYFHISHFIDNSDEKYCRSPQEKIMGIKQRITKKEGLIRSNIMGKRVNFCGRSVIGADSSLKFGEVGIPEDICNVLTVPERVHSRNIDYIRDLWQKREVVNWYFDYGPLKGRRYRVIDKTYTQLDFDGKPVLPMVNFIVERKVQNGDIVLVNRQPTLYKYGMIGNIVKKVPRKNIGMHMCETKMRNADFDGDEANIHVMQVLDARVEAMTFANVMDAIPDGLKNRVMIGMFFNALSSAYIMTREPVTNPEIIAKFNNYPLHEVETMKTEVILTKAQIEEAHSILSYKEDLPSLDKRLKKHGINPLSGKALFSCILPYNFNYVYEPDDKGNDEVIIKDGVLIKGRINNKHIGQGGGKSMQMSIWKWYGRDRAVSFITDCVFVTDWFIYQYGLTLGFDDIYLTNKIRNEIDNIKRKNIAELKIKIAELGSYEDNMTAVAAESREKNISLYLGDCSNGINKSVTAALSPENPLNIMAKSGAKGKDLNTAQITGMKGQEFVFKKRPEMKISNETRCLPYFDYNSQDIKARGFISHSFLEGMTPSEMYFMSEGAREGSISTATRTADSGDLSHKINKVLEDFKVCYDGSVRNASDVIFQFGYFDGYDGSEIINTTSNSTGPLLSFMNLKEAVSKINNEF